MPQTDQYPSLIANYDGTFNSYYPTGDKPAPPPEPEPEPPALSGGTPALAYAISALEDGATLTLTTDGTFDFGGTGPILSYMLDATKVDENGNVIPIVGPGSEVTAGTRVAVDDPDMPQGKAYLMEGAPNIVRVTHPQSMKVFDSRIYHWPQSSRDEVPNPPADINAWQIKPIWHMANKKYNGSGTNFFIVTWQRWYGNSTSGAYYWKQGHVVASNIQGVTAHFPNSQNPHEGIHKYPLLEPYTTESAWDLVDITDGVEAGTCEVYSSSQSVGKHYHHKLTGLKLKPDTAPEVDKILSDFTYAGYTRGFGERGGPGITHDADIYVSVGDGAFCRVAISDHQDYFQSSKRTILQPLSWASGEIEMKLRNGWWDIEEIGGCWINIIGIDNTQIASVKIGGVA